MLRLAAAGVVEERKRSTVAAARRVEESIVVGFGGRGFVQLVWIRFGEVPCAGLGGEVRAKTLCGSSRGLLVQLCAW